MKRYSGMLLVLIMALYSCNTNNEKEIDLLHNQQQRETAFEQILNNHELMNSLMDRMMNNTESMQWMMSDEEFMDHMFS
ncbi:MAG: hypothetical protein ACOCWA_07510 [Bacteroidota bacterium]